MEHESGHRIRSITDQDLALRKDGSDDGLPPEVDPVRGSSSDQRVAGTSRWMGCVMFMIGVLITGMVLYYLNHTFFHWFGTPAVSG